MDFIPPASVDGVPVLWPGAYLWITGVEGSPGGHRVLLYVSYFSNGMWYVYVCQIMSAYMVQDENMHWG